MSMSLREVAPGLWVHEGAVTTGALIDGDRALLFNVGGPGLWDALRECGVRKVDHVLFTHHRRELADGLESVHAACRPRIGVPAAEQRLFADPDAYWNDPASRWGLLMGHVPYHVTHITPVPPTFTVADGHCLEWHGWQIQVLETPGPTDGAVSYVVRHGETCAAFTGDLIAGPGRLWDLFTLQRRHERNGHRVGDYHGFMGAVDDLVAGLHRVIEAGPDLLVPAHGEMMDAPATAVRLLEDRVRAVYANYTSISALRWYFPKYFEPLGVLPDELPRQPVFPLPENVIRVQGQTWLLVADNRRALLLDPYTEAAVRAVRDLADSGRIAGIDGIWLTHYHADHVVAAEFARRMFDCPILTDEHMADVIEHPEAYFLTCLINSPARVERPTRHGETWEWENFTLSAWHLPGQTWYHSGLLAVPTAGPRLFFAGDSFTPTGIDDYCTWNRNFLGPEVGFRQCVRLVRQLAPDLMFNQHVEVGFHFSEEAWDRIEQALVERERLLGELLAWEHPDFGTDEYWIHTFPYEQHTTPGGRGEIEVRLWNHARGARTAAVRIKTPPGWSIGPAELTGVCPARTERRFRFSFRAAPDAAEKLYVLPVFVTFDGRDLGSFREALVRVATPRP
ncbi:MAG: MBL fold metallo-hydrolase [Kiritimatiellaeota bacterium]|nr:MBL fold metallo-hydrolase [Kiritimatiellota bacterium]